MQQHPSQIYKADFRGKSESEKFRCLSIFNFGDFFNDSRAPFGNLYVFNEETLAPGHKIKMEVPANSDILILPFVGGIDYKNSIQKKQKRN